MVNYKGQPFMQGLTENRFLMWSLSLCAVGAFIAASNAMPAFNTWLQLVEYVVSQRRSKAVARKKESQPMGREEKQGSCGH